jgi:L-histidine N-alpha-methyltransferase
VLRVVDRELDADFDPDDFDHVALWDPRAEWIEMRLRARHDLSVRLKELDLRVSFERGEELRTEISAKFRQEGVARELAAAGFAVGRWWTDGLGRFGLSLAEAV